MQDFLDLPEKVSSNQFYRYHFFTRNKIQKMYYDAVALFVRENNIKLTKRLPIVIHFNFYFKGRLLDCSNLSAMCKMIEDGFVKAGILPNDNNKNVIGVYMTCSKSKNMLITYGRDCVKITFEETL